MSKLSFTAPVHVGGMVILRQEEYALLSRIASAYFALATGFAITQNDISRLQAEYEMCRAGPQGTPANAVSTPHGETPIQPEAPAARVMHDDPTAGRL